MTKRFRIIEEYNNNNSNNNTSSTTTTKMYTATPVDAAIISSNSEVTHVSSSSNNFSSRPITMTKMNVVERETFANAKRTISADSSSSSSDDAVTKTNSKDIKYVVDQPTATLRPYPFFYYVDYSVMKDDNPLLPLTDLGKVPNFPAKMHAILSRKDLEDVISWMPHGRSWRVHKPREFEIRVIPAYFEHVKFSSFVRQANGWGFQRITIDNRDRNSYFHPKFLRGLPHLCKSVKRPGISKKITVCPEHEPDLYEISKLHAVPDTVTDEKAALVLHNISTNKNGIPCMITTSNSTGDDEVDASLSPHSQPELKRRRSSNSSNKSPSTSYRLPNIDIPIQHIQDPTFAATAANLSSLAAAHQKAFGLPNNQKLFDQYNYFKSIAQQHLTQTVKPAVPSSSYGNHQQNHNIHPIHPRSNNDIYHYGDYTNHTSSSTKSYGTKY